MLPTPARDTVDRFLARLDRALPGRVAGFYVVGSTSLGSFVPHRSDVDFIAVLDGPLAPGELTRLRGVHRRTWARALTDDLALRRHWPLVCNGSYVLAGDLARSPGAVTAQAAHVAGQFAVAPPRGFDVNPVTWHILARYGIAVRGPARDELTVHADAGELRRWVVGNLHAYWRRWEVGARERRHLGARLALRQYAAGGVLGAPRLHYTLATGQIATKEQAGEYARYLFGARWQLLIEDALDFRRGAPARWPYRRHPWRRIDDAAAFVGRVIDAATARWGQVS
jgi:hypothetical protein